MATHENLLAFRKSYELGLAVLRSTETWPKREMFGLAAQARRASTSISVNIAEGVAKRGRHELRRYLDIALGSLAELQVLLGFAKDMGFVPQREAEELEGLREEAGRLVWGLYVVTVSGRGRPAPPVSS
jgi:four helix bundle protein